ncbi:DnaB-like helicase C-terminal domain-containing protein [bacterium]|nr:DnaB-like helicase C-terminal domain-containing protein [bacterium]
MIDNEILGKVCSKIFDEQEPVLKTGFKDLDFILSGIEKNALITVGARPAMGKTSFITTILLNLLEQNKKCLFFSMEMSTEQLIKRLLCQISEVDAHLLNMPEEISKRKQSVEKITMAIETLSKYDLTITDGTFNIEKIREEIEQNKPEYVFIDYLQLINVPEKKPRSESFEKIMLDLKHIAKDNNCMIFISSQLSRALECRCDKRPLLSDLRESGAIENISDVVLFIYRDEYYNLENDEYSIINKGKAEIIAAKNRYGSVGIINLLFRPSIMKFLEPLNNDYTF